jgi:plastocyanin
MRPPLRAAAAALIGMVQAAPATAAPAAPTTHTVVIAGMKFVPESLTVKRGDTIRWVNEDFFPHTATARDGRFDSGDIGMNQTWSYVAKQDGTFAYICTLHPTMKGILIVK